MRNPSKKLTKKDLVGSWTLVSFKVERPRKGMLPWASKVNGILIYSADGKMSVSINSLDAKKDSLDHMLFYAGDYSIHGEIVHHEVRNASSLGRIDQTMFRKAVLKGRTLTLHSLPPSTRAELVWRRVR